MGKVIQFRQQPEVDYFGGCPFCRRLDACLNIGRDHWYACGRHRVKWCVGSNLFSAWRHENEAIWARNAALLAQYVEVEPLSPPQRTYNDSPADLDSIPF